MLLFAVAIVVVIIVFGRGGGAVVVVVADFVLVVDVPLAGKHQEDIRTTPGKHQETHKNMTMTVATRRETQQ